MFLTYGDSLESGTPFMAKLVWRLSRDSKKNDPFYGDFMIKLVGRVSGNLIYHVFSLKNPDNIHSFYIHGDNILFQHFLSRNS